jgi:hypothetical protein
LDGNDYGTTWQTVVALHAAIALIMPERTGELARCLHLLEQLYAGTEVHTAD